ncbi:helix-turn-helix domain-containing protein [Desulfovibrio fairfieldensis]|uniref:DNA-binding protein n=1 Tax=Desulfovibrio fairfieldensis TaxID=44742 RepID=A0A0X8JM96_9BACT|nr:helix-turn-helix domain-containing protein [Desulfovibrio fairfieldensis]AMD91367.1 DNA-binding protein [Desulfovibrio fairfieldensis]
MDDKRIRDYSSAMERIQAVTGCGTQRELGRFLGINQSAISDAKRRGTIPAEWLLTLLRGKGINPDWVLTGKGAHCLRPAETEKAAFQTVSVTDISSPE